MAQNGRGEREQIFASDVGASLQKCTRFRAEHEELGGTRSSTRRVVWASISNSRSR